MSVLRSVLANKNFVCQQICFDLIWSSLDVTDGSIDRVLFCLQLDLKFRSI